MRAPKFIETCKLKYGFEPTLEEAERSRAAFFHLYRQLPDWHKKQVRLCHLSGYVYNLAGRMRRLPGIHSSDFSVSSEAERMAINSPVQGYIGDHKAMAVVEIHETFDRETELRIVGEVHDSILLWIRPNKIDDLLPKVADIMKMPRFVRENKINLPVPIEAEFEVGPWGAGKTWKAPSSSGE
jgi:DNA polymerase I-like protein with 3'-5' exonuclease and polymerase domains